jgi:uncharacterized membrane protein YuzA (DUF378 family)
MPSSERFIQTAEARRVFRNILKGLAQFDMLLVITGCFSRTTRVVLVVLVGVCFLAMDVQKDLEDKMKELEARTVQERLQRRK